MKKATATLMMVLAITVTSIAQQVVKKEDKVKKTTTIPQKVHNIFSKHKKYSGTKTKHIVKVEKTKS
ncbi:MAG: hypothetical protein ABI367_07405 [Mucilaginibacter sp.]